MQQARMLRDDEKIKTTVPVQFERRNVRRLARAGRRRRPQPLNLIQHNGRTVRQHARFVPLVSINEQLMLKLQIRHAAFTGMRTVLQDVQPNLPPAFRDALQQID